MGMQKAVRIGAVALAVGLVGYAAFSLSRREPAAVSSDAEKPSGRVRASGSKARDPAAAGRSAEAKARIAKSATAERVDATPLPVKRDVDYEKTLDDLEAFVTDLESMQEKKQKLPQPEWVERYKRGTELVDALLRTDEAKADDRRRKEVNDLNMRFRNIIQDILMPPS
jgi:exonuclease VII small subunit